MTAPGEGDAAMSFDAQSVANNENLRDLHIKASFPNGTQDLQANDVAHLKNQLPGTNGSTSPSDAPPQVMDINLPTPTDSAVESTLAAPEPTAQPHTNGTAETTTAMETDLPPSTPVSAPLGDPAVQPPVSDARNPPEPVSQEQAAEIQAQKEAADPAQAAAAPAVPEPAADALPAQAETATPAASSDPVETDKPVDSAAAGNAPAVDLPHHSSIPAAISGLPEKPVEPTPTPVANAPAQKQSGAQPEIKSEVSTASASLPPPAQDTDMKDAPPSSPGKLSRSREDDSGLDEPEAKRMRPSSAAGSAIAAASPANPASPASQSAQEDRDFASPMSEPQSRAVQAVIANTKRNGHSVNFASPVDYVALNIPTYPEIIKNPMDLGTMHEKAKNKEYPNVQSVVNDFNLIVSNCEKFNGTGHTVTAHVYKLRETFDKQMRKVPGADFVEPPLADKKRKSSAVPPRQPARRETRVASQPKTPVAPTPTTPSFALNPDGMPLIRRDSTAVDGGRPKREIHPPAPKDLPYSARPKKKKFQIELRFCNTVLHELDKAKYAATATPFKTPVDPVALNIPTYHKIIKKPMDLSTMRRKLDGGMYENAKEFDADMNLIFANCFKFNKPGEWVYNMGKNLEAEYKAEWAKKDDYVRQNAPETAQSASSPEVESDEDEEDEEEEDDDEESAKIAKIQAQMAAMNEQLAALKKGKGKKKSPPTASKKKGAKPAKKIKKEDKKSSKKSKGAVPYVSYEQKQDISNRINTLPESRMMQALDIIKQNMPSLKGAADDELELDIDELSNDVLYKLLQFVRKYAPRAEDDQTERRQSYAPQQPSKPKKNKPMGASEQEKRIEALRRMQSGEAADMDVKEESSDDEEESDDESEEE